MNLRQGDFAVVDLMARYVEEIATSFRSSSG